MANRMKQEAKAGGGKDLNYNQQAVQDEEDRITMTFAAPSEM